VSEVATSESDAELIARLRRENAALSAELIDARQSVVRLRTAYNKALEELHLLKHRLFVAKAERRDTTQEQLAFDNLERTVKSLADQLQDAEDDDADASADPPSSGPRKRRKSSARRSLSESDLPLVRVELRDETLENVSEFIGFETSWAVGYERGGARRIQIDRAVYKTAEAGETAEEPAQFATTAMPATLIRRGILAPSMIAHVLTQKFMMGLPFYRQEEQLTQIGCPIDRGTMSRYAEEIGSALGNIVLAMSADAKKNAFCLATDATGVSIQLGPLQERERGPCRKGHFFIALADRNHVFFEYQPKHTSAAVCEMFRGFKGYLQADAHAIYDALFRGAASDEDPPPKEVGCWSHARRKFWEAAICKHALGVEGLRRIDALFAADRALANLAPARRKQRRDALVRPLVDAFMQWCDEQSRVDRERGRETLALGYALRHQHALRRFLDDGRLEMTNNGRGSGRRTAPTEGVIALGLPARSSEHRDRAEELAVLRERRPRERDGEPVFVGGELPAARSRRRAVPAGADPRVSAVAERSAPRALSARLGSDAQSPGRERARAGVRADHGSAGRKAVVSACWGTRARAESGSRGRRAERRRLTQRLPRDFDDELGDGRCVLADDRDERWGARARRRAVAQLR
jgi:hypothetical protein